MFVRLKGFITLIDSRVGVVGCGTMGVGIIEVAAVRGCDVIGVEADPAALAQAQGRLAASLERAESAGRLGERAADVLARVQLVGALAELADREVVIEAVVERKDVKLALFSALGDLVTEDCLLATNTSSLAVTPIAAAAAEPGRVVGLHFFNPVPRMPLVEVVQTQLTSPGTVERAVSFVEEVLGKRSLVAQDRAGFVVNVVLVPYLLSAMRQLDHGLATAEHIDEGMVSGCGMPMGPLHLADLIGLDTLLLVADCLYEEHREAQFVAPPVFRRLVDAGWLGRKTGRGFFDYS